MQKRLYLFPVFFGICLHAFPQNTTSQALLKEGISYNDQGDYAHAIGKYDEIIAGDDGFYAAYYEKSYTLYIMGKYQECTDLCKEVLKKFPRENNESLYVNYGSSLDALGKTDEALAVYKEGIKKYPAFYNLPFNRGVTEYQAKDEVDALADFKRSVTLNPQHPTSHLFLAYCVYDKNRIAALLAVTGYLVNDPAGKRAPAAVQMMMTILGNGVKQKDEKNITITLSPDALSGKSKGEDNFGTAEMMIAMRSALDYDEKYKNLPRAVNLREKLDLLTDMHDIKPGRKAGFFTNFYIPFLQKMRNDSLLETACYIMLSSTDDPVNKKWLEDNQEKVNAFNIWLKNYAWTKEEH